jgi:hypothetical protein
LGIRVLLRWILVPLSRALWRGDPRAWIGVAVVAALVALWSFIQFARRPLGGDPETTAADDANFQDDKNPYRETP